jgi:hypothetical protein
LVLATHIGHLLQGPGRCGGQHFQVVDGDPGGLRSTLEELRVRAVRDVLLTG